jgi:hypothetical protein
MTARYFPGRVAGIDSLHERNQDLCAVPLLTGVIGELGAQALSDGCHWGARRTGALWSTAGQA